MQTRTSRERQANLPAQNEAQKAANRASLCRPTVKPLGVGRYGGEVRPMSAQPKESASQSGTYMAAAKGLGFCMLCGWTPTESTSLDFCHGDEGKGMGLKTDVREGWPGCRRCHEFVGRSMRREARRAVEQALSAQTRELIEQAGTWPAKLVRLAEKRIL